MDDLVVYFHQEEDYSEVVANTCDFMRQTDPEVIIRYIVGDEEKDISFDELENLLNDQRQYIGLLIKVQHIMNEQIVKAIEIKFCNQEHDDEDDLEWHGHDDYFGEEGDDDDDEAYERYEQWREDGNQPCGYCIDVCRCAGVYGYGSD